MGKKMVKAILIMEDGSQKEYEGEGMVICAVTDDMGKKGTNVHCGVLGNFSTSSVFAIYKQMAKVFKEDWVTMEIHSSLGYLTKMLHEGDEDAGTDEEAPESPVE